MNTPEVVGSISERRTDSGRIKVISFKKSGKIIYNSDEIIRQFPPDGFVFAPSLFNRGEYELYSLIKFSTTDNEKMSPGLDEFVLDFNKDVKSVGYAVFDIAANILFNDFSINQAILKKFIDIEVTHFYISNYGNLYGPFQTINGEIIPKKGKEVCKWTISSIPLISSGESSYLLEPPTPNGDFIDCMTTLQLTDWLKGQLNNLQLNPALASLKNALALQELEGLDKARLLRGLSHLSTFSINYEQLKILINSSDEFKSFLKNELKRLEENIISENKTKWIEPLEKEKDDLLNVVSELKETKQRNEKELNETLANKAAEKSEYNSILRDKERLIQDIKLQIAVFNSSAGKADRLITYEEQVYKDYHVPFDNLNEFVEVFNSTMLNNQSRYSRTVMSQFKDRRCFLSDNVEAIIKIGRLSNNCKILLQQVEPDWLKFENFYENGLKQIWLSAHENKEMFHFLILQDLNLASIECYARPMLDLLTKVRFKLPGHNLPFPENLWVFGIPIDAGISDEPFGLPMIKNTYKEWGFFPKGVALQFNDRTSNKVLKVESIFEHNDIISISPDDYFN